MIKLSKTEDKENLESSNREAIHHIQQILKKKLSGDFSSEIRVARRQRDNIFKVMKEKRMNEK